MKICSKLLINSFSALTVLLTVLFTYSSVDAEISEFGGYPARFKGKGDLEPPLCNVEYPNVANEPFFIQWNCMDNHSSPDELQAEVWILRKSSNVPRKIGDYLGFPASIHINKSNVIPYESLDSEEKRQQAENQDFSSFLPIGIRLVVRDRSGTASLSPVLNIEAGTESSISCSLNIETESVAATTENSGIPALFAVASSIPVDSTTNISGTQTLRSSENFQFSTCELSDFCELSSDYSLQYSEQTSNSGTLRVTPQDSPNEVLTVSMSKEDNSDTINLLGTTTIDGTSSSVNLSCQ